MQVVCVAYGPQRDAFVQKVGMLKCEAVNFRNSEERHYHGSC